MERQPLADEMETASESGSPRQPRRLATRILILIRRIHLYFGLFLLPWVMLYGVTGAMFNHQEVFPEVTFKAVPQGLAGDSTLAGFPSAAELASQVVEALKSVSDGEQIELADDHGAAFTGDIMFEAFTSGTQHVVHLDPVSLDAHITSRAPHEEHPEPLLKGVAWLELKSDPHEAAFNAAKKMFVDAGIKADRGPQPLGWAKLNFLARVNGEPARITYVLKDGHVDVTRFAGQDGMTWRHYLLRLHTAHGQPPHWNARMFWSLFVDAMAVAMVIWGVSGVVMWWQIKRTRRLGSVVIALSLVTATLMCFAMHDFWATTLM